MSDPVENLQSFDTEGITVNPLPASEVRRRGNRMRRRNNALAAVGGLAAVAIIAVPLALGAHGTEGSTPNHLQPATQAPSTAPDGGSPEWRQQIPRGFPLTEGMPATNASDGSPVTVQQPTDNDVFPPCLGYGDQRSAPTVTVDKASVTYTGESEDRREAVLAVYRDQDTAAAALARIEDDVAGCRTQTHRDTTYLFDPVPSDLGEQSFVWTLRLRQGGDLSSELLVVQNVRVGNAIYALSYYGAGGAGQQAIDFTRQLMADESSPVVSDLCVFAAEPCELSSGAGSADPSPTGDATSGTSGGGGVAAIPADFPLLDGYPDPSLAEGPGDGPTGPSEQAEDLSFQACGTTAPRADGIEQLGGSWTNPEDFRARQLTTFPTTDAADAFVDGILDVYRACPTEDTGDGYTRHASVLDGDLGDRSSGVVLRYEMQGGYRPGLDMLTLVRVGRAVLVSTTYDEGSATTEQQVTHAAADGETQVAAVVDAMCPWAVRGC